MCGLRDKDAALGTQEVQVRRIYASTTAKIVSMYDQAVRIVTSLDEFALRASVTPAVRFTPSVCAEG